MYLYFVKSSQTPYVVSDDGTMAIDTKNQSNKILLKIFKASLGLGVDPTLTPGNSGENGIATIILDKTGTTVIKNSSIEDFDANYPNISLIVKFANEHLASFLSTEKISLNEFFSLLKDLKIHF